MYLKKINFKMILGHLVLLISSSFVLFIIFYFLITQSITRKNHEILEDKSEEYSNIYIKEGNPALEIFIHGPNNNTQSGDFFIRVADRNQTTINFLSDRRLSVFKLNELEPSLKMLLKNKEWKQIKAEMPDHDYEVLSIKLENGFYFQVGKTVVGNHTLMKRFAKSFIGILVVAIFLGTFGGMYLAKKILLPLKNLIATVKKIQAGKEDARVELLDTNDELEELTTLFNQMLDRIQSSNKNIRQTLDTIAHELRTPLTSIRGLAEVTLENEHNREEDYREVLENCVEGIDNLLIEFKLMTDITLVESGLQNLDLERVNIHTICIEVVDLYEQIAEEKDIKIILNDTDSLYLTCDKKKTRQAIANLIDNAIKYSPSYSTIEIQTQKDKQDIIIKVLDQGIGITSSDMPLIWKRLYRGENARPSKGMGLGLSLVKSIVEAHEGHISVANNEPTGSIFIISLPSSHNI